MNRFPSHLTTRIGIVMLIAIAVLSLGFYLYWNTTVAPQLKKSEQGKADLITMAYEKSVTQLLSVNNETQLLDMLDQLALLRDPSSKRPVLESISVTTSSGKILKRQLIEHSHAIFVAELPIFSSEDQTYLGNLRVEYNRAFYFELLNTARRNLFMGLSVGVVLLITTLVLLTYLLKPLRQLVQNIEQFDPATTKKFTKLEGLASEDIRMVDAAIQNLVQRLNESTVALQDSEAQVRLLLDSTAEAIFGVDKHGNCTLANPACIRMLGYEDEKELLGKNMQQMVMHSHPDGSEYPPDNCGFNQPLKTANGVHAEDETLWRKDGGFFSVEYSAFPILRNSEVIGAVVTFVDITERKTALAIQRRLLEILEVTPDLVGICNKHGMATYINRAGRQMLGLEENEPIKEMHISHFHNHSVANTILEQGIPYASEHGVWRGETSFLSKSGAEFPASQVILAHKNQQGNIDFYSTIARDITQEKLSESRLKENQSLLENLVSERTQALERSNRELESYSYSIAHDLRAPLRSIVGFGQILKEETSDRLTQEESASLNRMIDAGKRLAVLIDDILELSRISRAAFNPTSVLLSDIVGEIARNLQETDQSRKSEWIIQDKLECIADPVLLRIALENLLGNAWKYSSKETQTHIEVGRARIEDNEVYFVKDQGAGFDMKFANKLFIPFQRLHGSEYEGTGIGLATVERIIQRHGGKIWAEGEINHGATFYFSLPH